MNTPLVSIIIPTYNRADLISATLDSVVAQTHTHWECLIIDDGSTDATEDVVREYSRNDSRITYYKRPSNRSKGANACRNYGLEVSNGDYINFYDSDDLLHPDKLRKQVHALESSDFNFSVCQSVFFRASINNIVTSNERRLISDDSFFDYVQQKNIWLTQAPLWKSSFLKQNQFTFDEELMAAQEWEFHCRILFRHRTYHVINEPLVYLRLHDDNITADPKSNANRIWNYALARIKIFNYFKAEWSEKERTYFRKYFIGAYFNLRKMVRHNESKILLRHYILNDFKAIYMMVRIIGIENMYLPLTRFFTKK